MTSSDDARATHRLGSVLKGKYKLERVLGVGGMAAVYAATHRNGHECAVKMLHPELSLREDVSTRFLREAYIANKVKHPGAVRVQDDDVAEDGSAYLVMELLDGKGVEVVWEQYRNQMPVDVAIAIVDQLLDVLAVAHASGVVHRDIKPANLFLTREGVVKVLDFGIARARDAATATAEGTGSGMLLGTPAFMAPEQALAKSREIDARTDLWAAGATFFTMVTGRLVHEGENAPQLLVQAATKPAPSVLSVAPTVPIELAAVFDRALAFDKAQRWPSAGAMRDALREASRSSTGSLPARATLVRCFDPEGVGIAATMAASSARPAPAPRSAPIAPTVDDVPTSPAPRKTQPLTVGATQVPATERAAPIAHPLVGITTAQAVSQSMSETGERAGLPRERRPLVLWAALGALLVGAAGFGVAHVMQRDALPGTAPGTLPVPLAPSASATSSPTTGTRAKVTTDGMVRLPGGSFVMGPSLGDDDHGHTKSATVGAFWMDKTEVTVGAWSRCQQARACPAAPTELDAIPSSPADHPDRMAKLCNGRDPEGRKDHPINCVTAAEAETFCAWAGKRLPTEAEWEYAARVELDGEVTNRPYPWGADPPSASRVNTCGLECVAFAKRERLIEPTEPHALYPASDHFESTAPVGSFAKGATTSGILDLAGNVEEWTADTFAVYGQEPVRTDRAVRGGHFLQWDATYLRTTARDSAAPDQRDAMRGFRCATSDRDE